MFCLRKRTVAVVTILSVSLCAFEVEGAGNPDAAKGLIVEHCSECRAVPGYGAEGLPAVAAPPFQVIADNPETYTNQRLHAFLRQPHWPMGRFSLSPSDIDNVIAYLKSLAAE